MFHALPCGPKPKLLNRFWSPEKLEACAVHTLWDLISRGSAPHPEMLFSSPVHVFQTFSCSFAASAWDGVHKAHCLLYKINPKGCVFLVVWKQVVQVSLPYSEFVYMNHGIHHRTTEYEGQSADLVIHMTYAISCMFTLVASISC